MRLPMTSHSSLTMACISSVDTCSYDCEEDEEPAEPPSALSAFAPESDSSDESEEDEDDAAEGEEEEAAALREAEVARRGLGWASCRETEEGEDEPSSCESDMRVTFERWGGDVKGCCRVKSA